MSIACHGIHALYAGDRGSLGVRHCLICTLRRSVVLGSVAHATRCLRDRPRASDLGSGEPQKSVGGTICCLLGCIQFSWYLGPLVSWLSQCAAVEGYRASSCCIQIFKSALLMALHEALLMDIKNTSTVSWFHIYTCRGASEPLAVGTVWGIETLWSPSAVPSFVRSRASVDTFEQARAQVC